MLDSLAQGPEAAAPGSTQPNSEVDIPRPEEPKLTSSEVNTPIPGPQVESPQPTSTEVQPFTEAIQSERAIEAAQQRLASQAKQELPPPVIPQKPTALPAQVTLDQTHMERGSPPTSKYTKILTLHQEERRRLLFDRHHPGPEQTQPKAA